MQQKSSSKGFTAVETVIVILVIAVLALGGWFIWHKNHNKNTKSSNQTSQNQGTADKSKQMPDPYAGWKSETSATAGFTIKHPADWTYNSMVGRDNVEHITIDSAHMHLTLDSYKDSTDTKCPDCAQTLNTVSFTAPNIGAVDLKTITYKLDSGAGNALILELPDSTYYLPAKSHAGVSTTFRGISVLNSEQEYQAETPSQFSSNPDYKTAQAILKSIVY